MQELLEQVLDYLKGIWLKRRYIMISTWLICPIVWLYIAQMDNVYESEARVYADTQSLLRPLLKGLTVETNPNVQISLMIKTLLSRPNVERISRMTDLDIQAENAQEYEQLIASLKEDIKIKKESRENIFSISYENKDPEMAKNVVQSALTVFIENTLGENRSDSDSAGKFLDSQLKEYENRLLIAEGKLTTFKQKYIGILPGDKGGYYAQLKIEKDKLEQSKLELDEINTSILSAKKQLEGASNNPQRSSSDITDANSVTTSFDQRIEQMEQKLDEMLLRYTEKHPDVSETKRLLDNLKNLRKKELDSYYKSLAENSNGSSSNLNALNINPIYQEINIQLNQLVNEEASLQVRVNNYQKKVTELENKIHIIPEIEAELTALNRGYEITKAKYEQLLNRKETAQLAKQADQTTSKINFRIIDPPRAPEKPTGPKRILLLIVVTLLGLGVGVGLSLLFSQLNPVVTSRNQVTKETGIPIFGVIAATENIGLQQWHKKKTIIFIISNLLLLGLLACFIIYSLFPEQILAPFKGVL